MANIENTDIDEQTAASIRGFSSLAKDEGARGGPGIELPEFIRQKAQIISAHFLLPAGARILDMGCERGEITYMLALLNPRAEITGIDADPAMIEFARKTWRLPNLSYRVQDAAIPDLEDESVDGIVNSNILHHIYSGSSYDPHAVTAMLERQTRKLKTGGTMLVRDYMMPPPEEYVMLELPAAAGTGAGPEGMSDADLLVSFSHTARPMGAGSEGFFIEEVPARRDKTRLFLLPHKWACEFIHRKNYRKNWASGLKEEYTFFTWQDYRREMTKLGLRMVYSAPYWNPWVVENSFKGRFQLYDESYAPLPTPATNYFIVAQKVADRQSLLLEDRRPSQKPVGDLQITVVRDKKSGAIHELVKRPGEHCDIIPYRITSDNRLVIYVRGGYPRPIINAAVRGSQNLDGKKWSGHLVEPITMDTAHMTDEVEENRKAIFSFTRSYTGLRPKTEESWYVGQMYYPSPDRIDEAIEPIFIEVENPQKTVWPIHEDKDTAFTGIGTIAELDGADIIRASQVGLLPEPRLELHVFELMARYNIPLPPWIGEKLPNILPQQLDTRTPEDMLKDLPRTEFEDAPAAAVSLRAVKSVFVEEGRVGQATRGLSAQDVEFVISHDGIENIAAIMPLARDGGSALVIGLEPQILPVPNRLGGDGAMLNVPSFVLPPSVRNIDEAKVWIAGKFHVKPDQVTQLGESYFTHTGVTPQRIYPFVVANPGKAAVRDWHYSPLSNFLGVMRGYGWFYSMSSVTIKMIARTHIMMSDGNLDMTLYRQPVNLKNQGFALSTEKITVDTKNPGYSSAPSRVLGQRGGETAPPPASAPPKLVESFAPPRAGTPSSGLKDALQKISLPRAASGEAISRGINSLAAQLAKSLGGKSAEPAPPPPKAPDPSPPRGRK